MKNTTTLVMVFTLISVTLKGQDSRAKVDYPSFLQLSTELKDYRQQRLIDIETFNAYSEEKNTIILDTRSKEAFDQVHMKGAVHLNFSDFTDESLARIIGSKTTRILIYCNNNFESPKRALTNKKLPLALNIPTFINLVGYGYENVYELKGYLAENDGRVHLTVAESKLSAEIR